MMNSIDLCKLECILLKYTVLDRFRGLNTLRNITSLQVNAILKLNSSQILKYSLEIHIYICVSSQGLWILDIVV